ncbi:hypothetical protein WA026_012241 [Henosepilachna vigintioctopunctata]|uniref:Kinesin motor domain-containing protein n=1 Tax=Henosepilachna vigintioctopunctata TaxID=420089 RepID=A0AAW1V6J3_9CUCU
MVIKFKKLFGDAKIFYRIFPSEAINWDNIRVLENGKFIQVHRVRSGTKENSKEKIFKQFETDGILYNISQNDIYNTVMNGVIESVFQGQNAIVLAFGQTCSGKSSTIGGLHFIYKDRGIIPRCIENIFNLKEQLPKNLQLDIEISYVEILSMLQANDLLKPYPSQVDKHNIGKTLQKIKVATDVETLQYLFIAEGKKEFTCDTNYPSHIGSSIFTFHVTLRNMNFSDPYRVESKLHIIDLAGNDNFGDNSSHFKRSNHVGMANCTKSFMEHFLLLLSENDQELIRVKKRTNIVSQYLGDSFSRDSLLRFIGHLKTKPEDLFHAISMLRFGQIVKNLKPLGTTILLKDNELMKIATLQAKLDDIRKEKAILEMLRNEEPKELCQERIMQIQRIVEEFIRHQIDEDLLLKLGDIKAIVRIMKDKIAICEEEKALLEANILVPEDLQPTKIDVSLSAQRSLSLKQKQMNKLSDIAPPQPVAAQSVNIKENGKSHTSKTSQTKVTSRRASIGPERIIMNKKSKMSSSSLNNAPKRSSGSGKRKSVVVTESTASVEKSTKKISAEPQFPGSLMNAASLFLPEIIPDHNEVLKEYLNSDKTIYKSALEEYKKNEIDASEIYQKYLKEMKVLNSLFEILDLRKNEMMQSKFVSQFSRKQEVDDHGNIVKSEIEEKCQENLKKAEQDVASQQEIVLSTQADLKITLNTRQQIRNEIKNEFEEFCKNKYNVPIPTAEEIHESTMLEKEVRNGIGGDHSETEKAIDEFTQEAVYTEIYRNLKKLMINESKKKMEFLKKSIKWIHNSQIMDK